MVMIRIAAGTRASQHNRFFVEIGYSQLLPSRYHDAFQLHTEFYQILKGIKANVIEILSLRWAGFNWYYSIPRKIKEIATAIARQNGSKQIVYNQQKRLGR
jgi:hypothetical protein